MANGGPVIIVKRRRRGHHGHHGGAWKVAYADFVTAMMAFFLVLWIVGQGQKVRAGVGSYFRDPGILDAAGSGILPGGSTGIEPDSPAPPKGSSEEEEMDQASLERSAQRIRDLLEQLPEFESLKGQIDIKATNEGLRIELVDSNANTFFDSASAELKPATEQVLAVIAKELGSLARPVVVEGHTDSRPYTKAERYTNWELSADRANAARRQMERSGLAGALVVAVRGFADKQLANAVDPLDPRNRRISIVVVGRMIARPEAAGSTPAPATTAKPSH